MILMTSNKSLGQARVGTGDQFYNCIVNKHGKNNREITVYLFKTEATCNQSWHHYHLECDWMNIIASLNKRMIYF